MGTSAPSPQFERIAGPRDQPIADDANKNTKKNGSKSGTNSASKHGAAAVTPANANAGVVQGVQQGPAQGQPVVGGQQQGPALQGQQAVGAQQAGPIVVIGQLPSTSTLVDLAPYALSGLAAGGLGGAALALRHRRR